MSGFFKTTNTVLSAGIDIENAEIKSAKDFMEKSYKNKYNLTPHLTLLICPMPEFNSQRATEEVGKYLKNLKPFDIEFSEIHYEPEKKFFSFPVAGADVKRVHEEITLIANKFRNGYIREKDLTKVKEGKLNEEELEMLNLYGYQRAFKGFHPHITIGNIGVEEFDFEEVSTKLSDTLKNLVNNKLVIDRIKLIYHTDSEIQSEMKELWEKTYNLG